VANFSNRPIVLRKKQLVGVSEGHTIALCTTSPDEKNKSEWQGLLREKLSHLSHDEAEKSFEIIRPFASMWDGHLGKIEAVQHHKVTGGPPTASQPYRTGPTARQAIDKDIERMMSMDVIEPCNGPWASQIVLIPKPDGSIRFCVDYRRLNSITRKDSFELPRMDY
jgi:hypothetical protein